MHSLLSQLHQDHFSCLRLLRCLELELACYEIEDSWHSRLPIILDIFDYLQSYLEPQHHQLEELVFEHLLRKGVEPSEPLWVVRAQHRTLAQLIERAGTLFTALANQILVSAEELSAITKEYITHQLSHINLENRQVYPLIEAHMTEADWGKIAKQLQARQDPLFSESVREEYRGLYEAIIRAERGVAMGNLPLLTNSYPQEGQ